MQGDPRFGDIRIGAPPLAPDVMAITVPPDPFFSGTLSGDVILNSSAALDPDDLFAVVLHEAGLALGLGESTDPTSAMYPHLNPNATSSSERYPGYPGPLRRPRTGPERDRRHVCDGHPDRANPCSTLGLTPLVAYGDRTTLSDNNFFSVQPPALYFGPATFQLQTSGISFLQPQVEVFNQNFQLLGQAESASDVGDIVSVQLANLNPFEHYYIEVEQPRAERLRDRSLRPLGDVRQPFDREPGQLARHSARTVRFPERGGHRRATGWRERLAHQ